MRGSPDWEREEPVIDLAQRYLVAYRLNEDPTAAVVPKGVVFHGDARVHWLDVLEESPAASLDDAELGRALVAASRGDTGWAMQYLLWPPLYCGSFRRAWVEAGVAPPWPSAAPSPVCSPTKHRPFCTSATSSTPRRSAVQQPQQPRPAWKV